jgi:hypothetical protein
MLFPFSPWGLDPAGVAAQLGVDAGSPRPDSSSRPREGRADERGGSASRDPKSL